MNVAEPSDLAMSTSQAAVLRVLAGTTAGLPVRELARLSEVAPSRVSTVVRHAADRGLVLTDRLRGSLICRLNREHLAADAIIALVTLRGRMLNLLTAEISAWTSPVLHASLFGSAARGDGSTSSDLDVLLVPRSAKERDTNDWEVQLYDSAQRVRSATGNSAAWLVLTQEELASAKRSREPIISELERESITLAGRTFAEVVTLKHGRS
ncbi:MAG: nucleotidyltransferase domain-containing protein [Mycobacteriales bacterium]